MRVLVLLSFLSAVCAILGDPGISYWDGNISKSVRVKKFSKFSSVQMYVGRERSGVRGRGRGLCPISGEDKSFPISRQNVQIWPTSSQ